MIIKRSIIKYYAVSLLSLISAIVLLVLRVSSYVNTANANTYSSGLEKEISVYVCLHVLLALAVVAVFSACLIAKTEKGKRTAALAATLFAPIISNAIGWSSLLTYRTVKNWPWSNIVWSLVCIGCFVTVVLMAVIDERKENGAAQDQ